MQHLFWDSGVFTAYLCDQKDAYDVASLDQWLQEAKAADPKARIYTSTIASAEVLPNAMSKATSFEEFLEDFQGAVVAFDPNPNIMTLAGRLRSLPYKKGPSTERRLGTPDAILLATAVHVRDAYGVSLDAFHTYDGGGSRDLDGSRAVPLLGYETWCEDFSPEQMAVAKLVIDLPRMKPIHPEPGLAFGQG